VTSGLPSERARSRSAAIARRTAGMPPAARRSAMVFAQTPGSLTKFADCRSRFEAAGRFDGAQRVGGVGREGRGLPASVRLRPPAGVPGRRGGTSAPGAPLASRSRRAAFSGARGPASGRSFRALVVVRVCARFQSAGRPSAGARGPASGRSFGPGRRSGLRSPPASSEPPPGCGGRASGRSPARRTTVRREGIQSPRRGLSSRSLGGHRPGQPSERRTVVTA